MGKTIKIVSYPPCPMGDGEAEAQIELTLDEGKTRAITGENRINETIRRVRLYLTDKDE